VSTAPDRYLHFTLDGCDKIGSPYLRGAQEDIWPYRGKLISEFELLRNDKLGHAVAQLVEALRYKLEGRGFESFRPHYGPGVDSASNRNEY